MYETYAKDATQANSNGAQQSISAITHARMNGTVTLTLPVESARVLMRESKMWVRVLDAITDGPYCPNTTGVLRSIARALEQAFA